VVFRYHDWVVSRVLSEPETERLLQKGLSKNQGVQVGTGTYTNDGLVEVRYGLTLKEDTGKKGPYFYWYKEMGGIYLGEKGFERSLFIRMPDDEISGAHYPSLDEFVKQMRDALEYLRRGQAEIVDLKRRTTQYSKLHAGKAIA